VNVDVEPLPNVEDDEAGRDDDGAATLAVAVAVAVVDDDSPINSSIMVLGTAPRGDRPEEAPSARSSRTLPVGTRVRE
jgi:hypothetical protein